MRMTATLCDKCHADITDRRHVWSAWNTSSALTTERAEVEACSRACLVAAIQELPPEADSLGAEGGGS